MRKGGDTSIGRNNIYVAKPHWNEPCATDIALCCLGTCIAAALSSPVKMKTETLVADKIDGSQF